MKRKLNDESYWARNDNERGTKWKAYQSAMKTEQYKLEQLKKGK